MPGIVPGGLWPRSSVHIVALLFCPAVDALEKVNLPPLDMQMETRTFLQVVIGEGGCCAEGRSQELEGNAESYSTGVGCSDELAYVGGRWVLFDYFCPLGPRACGKQQALE
jgi:hypothetical protein